MVTITIGESDKPAIYDQTPVRILCCVDIPAEKPNISVVHDGYPKTVFRITNQTMNNNKHWVCHSEFREASIRSAVQGTFICNVTDSLGCYRVKNPKRIIPGTCLLHLCKTFPPLNHMSVFVSSTYCNRKLVTT